MARNRNRSSIATRPATRPGNEGDRIDQLIARPGLTPGIAYRRLSPGEHALYRDHLLRLDQRDRKIRFLIDASDAVVTAYCERLCGREVQVIGAFADGQLRGAVEISGTPERGGDVEIVTTVERWFQGLGIESNLVERAILLSERQGANSVTMLTLCCNSRV